MKVCIPTMGNKGWDELVSEHFGRAPTFTMVDLKKNEIKVLRNVGEHMGGQGRLPELLASEGIDVLLCSGIGPRAIKMFEQLGIEVYVGAYGTVQETVQAWQEKKLQMANDETICRARRHRCEEE